MPRSTAWRVALDTNTVVSGTRFHGPESALLQAGLRGDYRVVLPWLVVEETFRVLEQKFPPSPRAIATARDVVAMARIIPEQRGPPEIRVAGTFLGEASDVLILAALLTDPPDFFVTGDKGFLALDGRLAFPVLRTRAMLALLGQATEKT